MLFVLFYFYSFYLCEHVHVHYAFATLLKVCTVYMQGVNVVWLTLKVLFKKIQGMIFECNKNQPNFLLSCELVLVQLSAALL